MKRKTLEIYALVVCFAAIVTFMVALGIGAYDLVRITKPAFTVPDWTFKMYQDNDAFRDSKKREETSADKTKITKELPEQEATAMRIKGWNNEINAEKRSGQQGLVQCSIFLLIAIVVFWLHWRIAKKEKEM